MATERFSVIFSADGLKIVEQAASRAGRAYDEMLSDTQQAINAAERSLKNFAGTQEEFSRLEADRAKAAEKANRIVVASYRELGIKSERSVADQRRQAIAAYDAIRKSGVASAGDIARAQEALKQKLEQLDGQLQRVNQTARATGSGGFTILKGAIASFAGGAALQAVSALKSALFALGQSSIKASNDFQGFRDQLELIEGSGAKADLVLQRLDKFAATTPAELNEVVEAYIKLGNRGIKPTNDQLLNLVNLASSQRKGLNQLVEAVLDAQTGENERLKEFGITATKSGDQVTFAFGKTKTTVAATASEINKALIGFGQLPGVAGGAEKAMQRLDGQFSNFSDNLTRVQRAIGDVLSPIASGALSFGSELLGGLSNPALYAPLTDGMAAINAALQAAGQSGFDLGQTLQTAVRETVVAIASVLQRIAEYLRENPGIVQQWGSALQGIMALLNVVGQLLGVALAILLKAAEGWGQILRLVGILVETVKELWTQMTTASKWTDRVAAGWGLFKLAITAVSPLLGLVIAAVERIVKFVLAAGSGIGAWGSKISDATKPLRDFAGLLGKITGKVIEVGTDVGKKLGDTARGLVGKGGPLIPAPGGAFSPDRFPVTSPFGMRNGRLHAGTDYGTPVGTPLANIWGAGRITLAGFVGGYGNMVELTLGNGDIYRFGHLDRINVSTGQTVPPGVLLGTTGNTGRSTGPHLHLEYYPGGGAPVPYRGGRGGPEFSNLRLAGVRSSRFSGNRGSARQSAKSNYSTGTQLGIYPEFQISLEGTLVLDEESKKKIDELRKNVNDTLYGTLREVDNFFAEDTPESEIIAKYDSLLERLDKAYVAVKRSISAKSQLNQSYEQELAELRSLDAAIARVVGQQQAELTVVRELGIAYFEVGQTLSTQFAPSLTALASEAGFFESRIEEMANTISNTVGQAFNTLVDDLFSGSKSFGDSILNFLGGILKNIASMFLGFATQLLQNALFKGLLGLLGNLVGGSNFGGGIFGNLFGGGAGGTFSFGAIAGFEGIGFATGGPVYGPGTSTSDSIPALLSRGEFVLPARAVQAIGLQTLEKLRGVTAPSDVSASFLSGIAARYAMGGYVGGTSAPGTNAARTVAGSVVNINVTTPNADSFNRSEMQLGARAAEQIRRAQNRK